MEDLISQRQVFLWGRERWIPGASSGVIKLRREQVSNQDTHNRRYKEYHVASSSQPEAPAKEHHANRRVPSLALFKVARLVPSPPYTCREQRMTCV